VNTVLLIQQIYHRQNLIRICQTTQDFTYTPE